MKPIRIFLWFAGFAIGLAAEWAQFRWRGSGRWIPDLLVGWTFVTCGLIASGRPTESRSGGLMAATGLAWFLPNFAQTGGVLSSAAANTLFWHRGPLLHLVLTYPEGRTSSWLTRSAVGLGYVAALSYAVSHKEVSTIALACLAAAVGVWTYARSVGTARRAHRVAMWATIAVSALLGGEATVRLAAPNTVTSGVLLLVYEATLCAIAVGLAIGLLSEPWNRAIVTDLVVELGETRSGTLRDELAHALGDPSLEVGYWLPLKGRFVDSEGDALELPDPGSERAMTTVERDGEPIAVLVHDPAVLKDPGLVEAVSSAARLAASNARLQADVRARQEQIKASSQRILKAGDEERSRLERRLRAGAQRHLAELDATLRKALRSAHRHGVEEIGRALEKLAKTQEDLRRLARGLHPHELSERGLSGALASLVADSPLPVDLDVSDDQTSSSVEACAYFVISEALVNATKHAHASKARVFVVREGDELVISVEDDGRGGADPTGMGLVGLADRVETLGGTVTIESSAELGTRVAARIPLQSADPNQARPDTTRSAG